jgi:plasmid stabilization system protein ParE
VNLRFSVSLTTEAREDLLRLYGFLLDRDIETAARALDVITRAFALLETFPFSCRKAADGAHGPRLRELVIPFGSAGYVALFEIDGPSSVTVLAVRHQREEDYH